MTKDISRVWIRGGAAENGKNRNYSKWEKKLIEIEKQKSFKENQNPFKLDKDEKCTCMKWEMKDVFMRKNVLLFLLMTNKCKEV